MPMSLRSALRWFDLTADDMTEILHSASEIDRDPLRAGALAEVLDGLAAHFEEPQPWNTLDLPTRFDVRDGARAPAADRWFYVVAFARFLPVTLARHRERGVPQTVSAATFADLGRHVRIAHRMYQFHGFTEQHWLQIHLRGLLFDLGRLQFNLARLGLGVEQLAAAGFPGPSGTVVAETHIPESGPLSPAAVDESVKRARPFFDTHFGEYSPMRWATCDSWLLDPQLQTLLPGSNIADFGARFAPFGVRREADQAALDFTFRAPATPLDQLPRQTSLQRALIDQLSGGGHVFAEYGWLELP